MQHDFLNNFKYHSFNNTGDNENSPERKRNLFKMKIQIGGRTQTKH